MSQGVIPYIKPGRRTVLFEIDKVRQALARFEVKAVGQGVRKSEHTNAVVRRTAIGG
jgi:hypothetical protein